MSTDALIPVRSLFRFSVPCRFRAGTLWGARGVQLGEEYRIVNLSGLDGRPAFADVRVAWNESGLAFNVRVEGKKQSPWCRESQMDSSDGLHLWMDTRDTHTVHRASRFCHRYVFMPNGGGDRRDQAASGQLLINRAKEHPRPAQPHQLLARSEVKSNGYLLEAFVASGALSGYDPAEHPRLGFTYAVLDRELGNQTFSIGPEFPYAEDPSLWATLELVKEE